MTRDCLMLIIAVLTPIASAAHGQEAAPTPDAAQRAAEVFAQMAAVLEAQHIAPPTRQEMALSAVRFAQAMTGSGGSSPANLAQLASQTSPDTATDFVRRHAQRLLDAGAAAATLPELIGQGALTATRDNARRIEPESLRIDRQLTDNQYVGIGVSVAYQPPHVVFAQIFPRGPARKAGVLPGDRLLLVDGQNAVDKPLVDVVKMLRGVKDSAVAIRVTQPDGAPRDLQLVRGVVPIDTVEGARRDADDFWLTELAGGDHYLRIVNLVGSTAAELRTLATAMQHQQAAGVVLDLRRPVAGEITHLRLVADALLAEATVGRLTTNDGVEDVRTTTDHVLHEVPLVVLIGPQTTPPMHWLAYNLKKHRPRTELLGPLRLQLAPMRNIIPTPDGGGIEMTTGLLGPADTADVLPATIENQPLSPFVPSQDSPPLDKDAAVQMALKVLVQLRSSTESSE